jgi:hypothetical protein
MLLQGCVHLMEAACSLSCSSARSIVQVQWCCCHWGLRPHQLLMRLPDEAQLAAEVASFDCRELTAAAWTCGILQDERQRHLLQLVAMHASSHLPISGVLRKRSFLGFIAFASLSPLARRCLVLPKPVLGHLRDCICLIRVQAARQDG